MENPAFVVQLELLTAASVAGDLGPNIVKDASLADVSPNWSYLLLSASALAISPMGSCQAAALRIAHSCITDDRTSPERKDAAASILDTLANHPALNLAVSRNFVPPDLRDRLPLPLRIEWTRRSIEDSISVGERAFRVNHFQKNFWRAANGHDWLSVSAPTSAGKSFIVSQWVTTFLSTTRPLLDPAVDHVPSGPPRS